MQSDASVEDHAALLDDIVPTPGMLVADRYQLAELIGEGTFGQVFRARDLALDIDVALKLLSAESVHLAGHERLKREAALARKLIHENTVRLLDFNVETKPSPYIAYELLRGETLDHLLKRAGAMAERRVGEVARQVLSGLAEAHAAGIVHRDIKPANVFVRLQPDGYPKVKVLDFGIAKSTESTEVALTQAGILIGTPRYMPPEQIRGTDPSPAMDLYAVGMMMAEMLNGAPILRCSAAEACLVQLQPEPIALPEAALRSRLAPIIRRATQKDTASRYASARQMLDDLDRVPLALSLPPVVQPAAAEPPDQPRYSQAPTAVMPVPVEAAARGGGAKWLIAALLLLVVAMAATAYFVYALRVD